MLWLNFTAFVVFVNRLPGPLAKTLHLRSSFFDAFTDIGSQQAKAFLEAKLRRAAADPAAAQLRSEVDGDSCLKRKRAETELLELDLRCARASVEIARARAEIARADADAATVRDEMKKAQIGTYLHCFEMVARVGVRFDDRARLQVRDMVGSVAPAGGPTERRKELCVRSFLLSKKVDPKQYETRFGKIAARRKREKLKAAGLSEVLPTKTIEVNGQVVEAKLYFEDEDSDVFNESWEELVCSSEARPGTKGARRK